MKTLLALLLALAFAIPALAQNYPAPDTDVVIASPPLWPAGTDWPSEYQNHAQYLVTQKDWAGLTALEAKVGGVKIPTFAGPAAYADPTDPNYSTLTQRAAVAWMHHVASSVQGQSLADQRTYFISNNDYGNAANASEAMGNWAQAVTDTQAKITALQAIPHDFNLLWTIQAQQLYEKVKAGTATNADLTTFAATGQYPANVGAIDYLYQAWGRGGATKTSDTIAFYTSLVSLLELNDYTKAEVGKLDDQISQLKSIQ